MTMSALQVIPAGAGSGKTYTIQQRLGELVKAGTIQPERIVAVTFTEAAAAELRERIRKKLLEDGQLDAALRLDQAYISTIHAFGLRLLTEFAFDAGHSPRPRLLNDEEQGTLIRQALAHTDKADRIAADLDRYGYKFDYSAQKSAETVFRETLLEMVSALRSAGWREESDEYREQAVAWVRERFGSTGNGEKFTRRLGKAVDALLERFPDNLAPGYESNKSAYKQLNKDFYNLHRAQRRNQLETDWQLWKSLRELRLSKRGAALPDGYDALAEAVIEAASALPEHPGALRHATEHLEALLAAAQDVLVHYAEARREAGLVDYVDMIAMAGDLLRENPEVLQTLRGRIDCLVVDEFQDTNPLQFALLWQLQQAGVPSILVGDLKQAIMGFQGADPRLFAAIIEQHRQHCAPLTSNWRSQPGLMHFINALGPALFGQAYIALEPQKEKSRLAPLEVIDFAKKAKKDFHKVRAWAVGRRLQALLADPEQQRVKDRRSGQWRRLRGGDIAILCPTHNILAQYASVLRAMGMKVAIQEPGWYETRAVQLARNALAYVANPEDRHAALYLAVTELGSLGLADALRQLIETGKLHDPLLAKLDEVAAGTTERTIFALVSETMDALEMFDITARWPEAEQIRANLLRLLAEAGEFMDANREALARAGIYGSGVASFLAWLEEKVAQKDQDNQPRARVLDEDAVELVTWHSAKGREWPVVAVCGMDQMINARLPRLSLGYRSFEDLSRLFDEAQIEFSPKFFAPESDEKFLGPLQQASETEARRLLYVALTRPRDKLILEWPSYKAGGKGTCYWSILVEAGGLALDRDKLLIGDDEYPCVVTSGDTELAEELDQDGAITPRTLPAYGRLAITPGALPEALTADSVTPSLLPDTEISPLPAGVQHLRYGEGLDIDLGLDAAAAGSFMHRCFEVLGDHPAWRDRLLSACGIELDAAEVLTITACVGEFEAWLKDYFNPGSIERELPILALNQAGSVVSGLVDMVVRTAQGVWIIDHKSDRVDDLEQGFTHHLPQLALYASALQGAGEEVLGIAINWISRGVVSTLDYAELK